MLLKRIKISCSIAKLSAARKAALEQSRLFFQFLQDSEEDEAWLVEKIRMMKSQDIGRDLLSCMRLIKKHEVGDDTISNPSFKLKIFYMFQ